MLLHLFVFLFFLMTLLPTRSTLFPYTTLFRSIQSATSRQNTKDQVYAQNEMLAYQQKESTARVASIMENTNLSKQQQVSEIMRNASSRLLLLISKHQIGRAVQQECRDRSRMPS